MPEARPGSGSTHRLEGEEFVFSSAVEGLYLRALRERMTPELQAELKAIGLDIHHVLPAYPLALWEHALRLTAAALFPGASMDVVMAELGRMMIAGYQLTAIGKAMFPLMRILGPTRLLQRLSRSFQSANNYTETRVIQLSPNEADLWISRVIQPSFYLGVLEAGLHASGARELKVALGEREGTGFTFHIRWA